MRRQVRAFAEAMEAKLRKNDHKGGWEVEAFGYLLKRLRQETGELERRLKRYGKWRLLTTGELRALEVEIGREAADVANFAMMIADNCGALIPREEDKHE